MKNKLPLLAKLILLLFLVSCEKEEFPLSIKSKGEALFKVESPCHLERISLSQAPHLLKIKSSLDNIDRVTQAGGHIVSNSGIASDVTVLTDRVSYIRYGDRHTYTFAIKRQASEGGNVLENLVLYSRQDGSYDEYIVQYTLTKEEKDKLRVGLPPNLSGKVKFIPLGRSGHFDTQLMSTTSNSTDLDCKEVVEQVWVSCSSGKHHKGNISEWPECTADRKPSAYVTSTIVCDEIGGGDDGLPIDSGTPIDGGGGSGSSSGSGTGSGDSGTGSGDSGSGSGDSAGAVKEIGGVVTEPVVLEEEMPTPIMLNQLIYEKPFALYGNDVPCALVQQWIALAKFEVSPELKQKVQNIPGFYNSTGIHNINNALSSVVNMDYFSVNVKTLPIINGQRTTPQQFLEYIRLNINQFVDPTLAQFTPYHSVLLGVDDRQLWNSSNALGAIVSITIPGDPGSVIVSRHNSSSWIFSTIKDPLNGTHPVSGNREFGYIHNNDGTYTFYTKGVDRLTDIWGVLYQSWDGTPFKNADALWTSFQNKIIAFANNPLNGGTAGAATKGSTQTERPDWIKVRDVRDGKLPLKTLSNDCK